MAQYLTMAEVIIWILLIAVILIQNKNVSLNLTSMWGWMGEVTRRWSEKVLHNTTVLLWTIFIALSIIHFVIS